MIKNVKKDQKENPALDYNVFEIFCVVLLHRLFDRSS